MGQLRANSGNVKKGRFHNGVACKNGHFRKGLSESLISFVSTRYFDSFFLGFFRFAISRFDRVKKSSFLKGFVGQLRANSGSVEKGRLHNGLATKNGHFRKGLS